MSKEIQALERNETWTLQDLPPGKKLIGCKWVYRVKYNSDGMVQRFKARLVVRDDHQVEGLDYNETFAPVAKWLAFDVFCLWQFPRVGSCTNWMLITYSSMATWKKRSI